jgi:hypothetical protein
MPPLGYLKQVEQSLPGTFRDIESRCGLSKSTIKRWVKFLRAENRCYVGKWVRCVGSGGFMPYFEIGEGVDAVCKLRPYTPSQQGHRYRRKRSKDPELAIADRNKASAKYWPRKAAVNGDPVVNLFFGRKK